MPESGQGDKPRGVGLILLSLLAKSLTAAKPVTAFDGSFVLGYDCSDLLLEEGRESQSHAVDLQGKKTNKKT